ncbi:MAG: GH116 family glycosyl hydrolase [Candidatus Margulisbacteria bacterium]|nr:GH116 family glycosyl hydrolase [Candidatus Margulisiibacteriota bacterium]
MQYGYFDKDKKEYVITQPDTPLPWINYLGAEEYCALMSNTAGGYSFYRDPKERRILRYRYNNVPMDRGGRYLYLRDNESGAYWSPTWQPTMTKLDKYECRHGLGYTIITAEYQGISTKAAYFVPLGENLEIWQLDVTADKARDLSLFSFVEFCLWDALNDMTDYQYNLNIGQTEYKDNIIYHLSRYRVTKDVVGYFACSNAKAVGFDTQRKDFMGNYGDWSKPRAVIENKMHNSLALGWAPVGSQMLKCKLKAGEAKTFIFVLGFTENIKVLPKKIQKFSTPEIIAKELKKLAAYWGKNLNKFTVQSEDPELDLMLNTWNQYQCLTTFNWSRSASYYESGIGRGMGFRDSNQDTLGFVHLIPEKVKARIKDLAATQLPDGSAYHQYSPLTKKANPSDHKYGDDHLWLIFSVASYLKESGDFKFLLEQIPFASHEKGTLYEHLARAIKFSSKNLGPHGLPLILFADWNDCLNLDQGKGQAESVMVAQMFVGACQEMARMAELIGKAEDAKRYKSMAEKMKKTINEKAWDGAWYVRAYTDDKEPVGSSACEEGKIYLETQAWGVLSGTADEKRSLKCMDSVNKLLASEHGIHVMTPPYSKFYYQYGSIGVYPPGLKENGAIFCHPNPWAMVAECILGRGDIAYQYYKAIQPAARNKIADLHKTEPYVYCQMIAGRAHKDFGEGKNSWLTGSACWNFVAASQWILGIRPDYQGLFVDPCLPKAWKGFKVKRVFRGSTYNIIVKNPQHVSKGVKSISLDGKSLPSNLLPCDKSPGKEHQVEVVMG